MKLGEAFGIKQREVISLVGGGGKTTLMFALARELVSTEKFVVTTTTTKVFEPSSSETPFLLLEREESRILDLLPPYLDMYRHVTLSAEKLSSGKLQGISPELVAKLGEVNRISYIIVEADGAAGKPLKAPAQWEPVIPSNTSLVVPIAGVDALGCRLTDIDVFRPEIVSRLTGLPLGEVVSADVIAILITHPKGITKGSPAHARIVPFINKVNSDGDLSRGKTLASKILNMGHPQIDRVILGQAKSADQVVEVALIADEVNLRR